MDTSTILLNKRYLLVGMPLSWKINSSKKEAARGILNLQKFRIYKPIQKYLWLNHKKILNQKYPRMRYIHNTHLLSKGQIECIKHLWDIILSLKNNNSINIIQDDDPLTYSEAIMSRDSDRWLEAIKFEMDSMYTNKGWILVDAPEGVTPIGGKWVFKKKIGANGQVETYKAKVVVGVFRQR